MIENTINSDLIASMKSKDVKRVTVLRSVKSSLQNYKINKKLTEITDKDIISVIRSEIKKRNDSIEAFKLGNRFDLVESEQNEINILTVYLPAELSPDELREKVKQAINIVQPTSKKDMGRVIKASFELIGDKADGKTISTEVNRQLSELNI